MLNGERKKSYKRGIALFHFAIGKTGILAKFGPIARWWYHSSSGRHDRLTVGVEIIHRSGKFKKDQYDTLFWLLFEYMPYHCHNYRRIVSHDYNYNTYSNGRKGCPGPEFEWNKLETEMKRRGIKFTTSGFEEYEFEDGIYKVPVKKKPAGKKKPASRKKGKDSDLEAILNSKTKNELVKIAMDAGISFNPDLIKDKIIKEILRSVSKALNGLDKPYKKKSLEKIRTSKAEAIKGISPSDQKGLEKTLSIKSIKDMAKNRHFSNARIISVLSDLK